MNARKLVLQELLPHRIGLLCLLLHDRNSSPGRVDDRRVRTGHSVSMNCCDEELEGVQAFEQAAPSDGEEAGSKLFPFRGSITKTDFPPRHCRPNAPFGHVAGGLEALMLEGGNQMVPGGDTVSHSRERDTCLEWCCGTQGSWLHLLA